MLRATFLCFWAAALAAQNYLLITQEEIDAAARKAEKHAWARAALDQLMGEAGKALAQPVDLPARGGQWPHWYSCKKDGVTLQTVSASEHRCPKCGAVYTGDPYDAVVLYGLHSRYSRAVRDLGLAYRFTGRADFAAKAREILTAYASRYGAYARHNIHGEDKVGGGRAMAQTLDESVWLIPIAWGYALVRESMSEDERRRVEQDLLVAAADVIREHRMGIHNIQCWKNSAVALAGLAAGNQELVKEAIEDPARGFHAQIAKGVTDDGLWWEGSLGYHHYTMQAIWPLAEAARRAGIDLYGDRYRTLYDAPLALAFPDGEPPGFNDSRGGNVLGAGPLYEIAYARWKRPGYGRLVARTKRDSLQSLLYGEESVPGGPMIPEESQLLKSAGYAMLRAKGTAAALRFGMHGGGHGHPDKLNLVTFGAGRMWGLDPGSINYGVPLHQEWYRATIAHNTVAVDEAQQKNTDGALEEWSGNGVAATAGEVYPGVSLRRAVRVADGRIEDRFECASESEHTYDWAFHAPGALTTSLKLEAGASLPYKHIEEQRAARTDDDWWARWEANGATYTLRMKGAPGTEVIAGVGPGRRPEERVPLIVVRRRAAKTAFEAVHEIR